MKYKQIFLIFLITLIFGLLTACQPKFYSSDYDTCADFSKEPAQAPLEVDLLSHRIDDGLHLKKASNLLILVDDSTTMQDCLGKSSKRKIALDLADRINRSLYGVKLAKGIRVFGVNADREDLKNVLGYGILQHNNNNIRPFVINNTTFDTILNPVAMAVDSAYLELKGVTGDTAIIILSDLSYTDDRIIESAEMLKNYYGDKVCLYPVVISQQPESYDVGEEIVKEAGCGIAIGSDKLTSPEYLTDRLEKMLFDIADKLPELEPIKTLSYKKLLTDKELRVTLRTQFELDKDIILPQYTKHLQAIADFMQEHKDVKSVIEGHTCNLGSVKYNLKLSLRRAQAVRDYLVNKLGVSGDRLQIAAYGESRPIADNSTEEGRVLNRRAVAVLTTIVQVEAEISDPLSNKNL